MVIVRKAENRGPAMGAGLTAVRRRAAAGLASRKDSILEMWVMVTVMKGC